MAVIAASQVAQIFVNWTGIALVRCGVEEFVRTGHITDSFWARTSIFLPNTLLLLLFGFAWLPLLSGWLKLPAEYTWYVAAHFVVSALWLHIQYAMQAAKLPRMQGIMLAAERIAIFVGLCVLIAASRLDGVMAISVYIAAPATMAAIGLLLIRTHFTWRLRLKAETVKDVLRFSVPLIPFALIGYFSTNYLDAIFISQYLSKAELGVYSIAYQMNGILMQFPLLAGSLLLPLFVTLRTGGDNSRVTKYMETVLPLLTLIGGVGGVCAAMVMKFLIPAVFGQQASEAVIVFWILVTSGALAIPVLLGFSPFTNAVSKTYVASLAALMAALVNLVANYLLIPRYGLKGCAWATVFAYGSSVLVFMIIGRFRFSLRQKWLLPAFVPILTASGYASFTGDITTAFFLAIAVSFVIVLIWRKAVVSALVALRNYRAFAAG